MPRLTSKVPGDIFYPQEAIVTSEPVSAMAVDKGEVYTKGTGANGNQLIEVPATGFDHGIYQAMADIDDAGTAGQHKMQCLGRQSYIGLTAKDANLHAGDRVKWDRATKKVEASNATDVLLLGTIYKIYTRTNITTEKDVTAADDVVIVQLRST